MPTLALVATPGALPQFKYPPHGAISPSITNPPITVLPAGQDAAGVTAAGNASGAASERDVGFGVLLVGVLLVALLVVVLVGVVDASFPDEVVGGALVDRPVVLPATADAVVDSGVSLDVDDEMAPDAPSVGSADLSSVGVDVVAGAADVAAVDGACCASADTAVVVISVAAVTMVTPTMADAVRHAMRRIRVPRCLGKPHAPLTRHHELAVSC